MSNFIIELPLKISKKLVKILTKRFEAARFIYNAILGESLKRLKLARESKLWQKASKTKDKNLYKQALDKYKFSEYSLHVYVKQIQKEFSDHIDSSTAQKIATRAFLSVKNHLYKKRGKPRFKGKNQFNSIEGKSNITGIRFKDGKIIWKDLVLDIIYDKDDLFGVEEHALNSETKFVRLIRRFINKKERFYAQLVQVGKPKVKHSIGKNIIGLDIGPSTITYVSKDIAKLTLFGKDLDIKEEEKKKLQRKKSRKKINSNNYKNLKLKIAEINRKEAQTRKKLHGNLCNEILKIGNFIKTEKLSYKAFQKMFGKSVNKRAPGKFIEMLSCKAENAGGKVFEFSPNLLKLSQRCHKCNETKKKSLSERFHNCCGIHAQRDLYSAFLAQFVDEQENFDNFQANIAWTSAESLLEQALSECHETMSGDERVASFGLNQRQNGSPAEGRSMHTEVLDVVSKQKLWESQKEVCRTATRTP